MEPANPITLLKPWSIIRVERLHDEKGLITDLIITHPGGYVRNKEPTVHLRSDQLYVDREGTKVGPLIPSQKRPGFPWYVRLDEKRVRTFTAAGCYHLDGRESPYDLVAEFIEPVKPGRDIDQVNLEHFQRGVARTWDSYKLLP